MRPPVVPRASLFASLRRAAPGRAGRACAAPGPAAAVAVVVVLSAVGLAAGCRAPHDVRLVVRVDPRPSSCPFRVEAKSSRHGVDARTLPGGAAGEQAFAYGSERGDAWAITAAPAAPDPACAVLVGCSVLVDGVEAKSASAMGKVTCSYTVP